VKIECFAWYEVAKQTTSGVYFVQKQTKLGLLFLALISRKYGQS
jgi:hypothetical protein